MYTKQEISKQKEAFWTTFGQYMQPVASATGVRVNWVNYKTGVQGISFKMDADHDVASIAIVMTHSDSDAQQLHYDQLRQLKTMLRNTLHEDWLWEPLTQDAYGKTISRVGITIQGENINRNEDWPALITFFKHRMVSLDAFWSEVKYMFEP